MIAEAQFNRATLDCMTALRRQLKRTLGVTIRLGDPDAVESMIGLSRDSSSAEIRELVRRGALVQEGGVVFAASAIDHAALVVARLLADQPDGITVAEARDAWGTTRKFAIPLITRLDETGVTRRRGDLRIAGPRLPQG